MTEKLFHTEPQTLVFSARVISLERRGNNGAVVLDRTAFYPESGGQPADRGTLGTKTVLDVQYEGEKIVHLVDGPAKVGSTVEGKVDAARREDHSVHHSAQHLITTVFLRHGDYRTMTFHLGSEVATIDLTGDITPELLDEVGSQVNREVRAGRPLEVRTVTRAEFDAMDLRKKDLPEDVKEVRLVEIEGVDVAHCGGTHVNSTSEIGFVVFARTERVKNLTRLHFLAGERARKYVSELKSSIEEAASVLSAGWRELPNRAKEILEDLKNIRKMRKAAEKEVIDRMVREFAASSEPFVEIRTDDIEPAHLAALARRLGEQGKIAVVSSGMGLIAIATPEGHSLDAGSVVAAVKKDFPVKGGGRGDFAQIAEVSKEMMPAVRRRIVEMFREAE
jgi:alanyl-tRNA synthetase